MKNENVDWFFQTTHHSHHRFGNKYVLALNAFGITYNALKKRKYLKLLFFKLNENSGSFLELDSWTQLNFI